MLRAAALAALLLAGSCQRAPVAEGPGPERVAAARAQCDREGGTFATAGAATALVCVRPTRDAGQSCASGRDCDGQCLARSMTCAPVTPLFGCHEVLSDAGRPENACLQ